VALKSGAVPPVFSIYDGSYSSSLFPALPRSQGPDSALKLAVNVWQAEKTVPVLPLAFAIIGSGEPTLTELTDIPSNGTCLQGLNYNGDNTVPLKSALGSSWVPAAHIGFVQEQHAWLAENPGVIQAVVQILRGHMPTTLATTPFPVTPSTTACEN